MRPGIVRKFFLTSFFEDHQQFEMV